MNNEVLIAFLLCHVSALALGQADNVILVTIDGLRWQEVFRGLDPVLAQDEQYSERQEMLAEKWGDAPDGLALMPFLHEVVFTQGSVIGNRDAGSCAHVTNPWYFSYPGYNEILTGFADPAIDSNNPVPNPNVTFLEWLQNTDVRFDGKVAAFASWNVFPAILNTARSGVPVNIGKLADADSDEELLLNRLHDEILSPWPTVRLDAFTHHYALSAMRYDHPRVLYIAYGETDDFAHDGEYDQYVLAAHRTDRNLAALWEQVQSDPFYRDHTVMFITVDHGRGETPAETWQHHASKESLSGYMEALAQYENGIEGSNAVWMAAIGPGVAGNGLIANSGCAGSNQVAATLLQLLGKDPQAFSAKAGMPLSEMLVAS